MANEIKEFFEKFGNDIKNMKELTPDAIGGFASLFTKVMKDGAISLREKELIALGIAVNQQCEPCIKLHVKKCLECGATKEQILDSVGVAVMMGGGPAYTHIPIVIDTLKALEG